jgi:hypothetical protein
LATKHSGMGVLAPWGCFEDFYSTENRASSAPSRLTTMRADMAGDGRPKGEHP